MTVDKAHTSFAYDVELDDKHYSVVLETDINTGYTNLTVMDEEGYELNEETETYEQVIAEVHRYLESQNSNYRRTNKMKIDWQLVLKGAEAVLRVVRKIMIRR
jgi:hypothetical protein